MLTVNTNPKMVYTLLVYEESVDKLTRHFLSVIVLKYIKYIII